MWWQAEHCQNSSQDCSTLEGISWCQGAAAAASFAVNGRGMKSPLHLTHLDRRSDSEILILNVSMICKEQIQHFQDCTCTSSPCMCLQEIEGMGNKLGTNIKLLNQKQSPNLC
jgi:hypothetical protein